MDLLEVREVGETGRCEVKRREQKNYSTTAPSQTNVNRFADVALGATTAVKSTPQNRELASQHRGLSDGSVAVGLGRR